MVSPTAKWILTYHSPQLSRVTDNSTNHKNSELRLVNESFAWKQSSNNNVEIEYGADCNSTLDRFETDKSKPYSPTRADLTDTLLRHCRMPRFFVLGYIYIVLRSKFSKLADALSHHWYTKWYVSVSKTTVCKYGRVTPQRVTEAVSFISFFHSLLVSLFMTLDLLCRRRKKN